MTRPEFYSVQEVADTIGVSRSTVHRWIHAKAFPAFRIGHQFRIPVRSLNQFIQESRVA